MKRALILTVPLMLVALSVAAQHHDLAGTWVGGYETDGQWIFIEARFWRAGDRYQGRIDLGGDTRRWKLISDLSLDEAGNISIGLDELSLVGQVKGDVVAGGEGTFTLERTIELPIDSYKPFIGNSPLKTGAS